MTEGVSKMDIDKPQRNNTSNGNRNDQSQKGPGASSNRRKGRYRKRGKKSFGDEKSHDQKRPKASKNSNICFQFAEKGTCDRGDKCRFSHQPNDEEQGSTSRSVSPPTSMVSGDSATEEEPEQAVAVTQKAHITDKRFGDLTISEESRRALAQVFKYEFMTTVQAETLPVILKGGDCLAKAKTGTGKTLGFLIPTVEVIKKEMAAGQVNAKDVCSLVISPTRELAFQIAAEAASLLTHHKNINVVSCVGGTNINKDLRALDKSVQIVVATPGRLLDHLENAGLAQRMAKMQVLVLDEADQLLDMGFRPDIERILKMLRPSESTRQTLLFSATVPKSVSEIAKIALRPKYDYVDTVGEHEEQTHLHVKQQVMVAPHADHVEVLANILSNETSANKAYKIIVFFTTARLTGFMAELFNSVTPETGVKILEIHSRKSQAVRKRASDTFRNGRNGVLFTSDVSARGMDYPDVSLVVQVGLTDRAQYIHRLGRTARAGKKGRGVLLLSPDEQRHMVNRELKDMPLERATVPPSNDSTRAVVSKALGSVSRDKALTVSAEQAYRAWLGYYNSNLRKCNWTKEQLVVEANQWAKDMGLKQQPRLQRKTVGKMGLKGVSGLLLE